ncbi:USB1 [Sanghuangporus sanghuang]
MKRNINLVAYESSDDDHGASENHLDDANSARKLPKLSPLLSVPVPVDNPTLHQGRVRTSPHVEGQFAAFVYVPVPLKKNTPLRQLLGKSVNHAKDIEPALVCDWLDSPGTHTLHISLTRPIYLRNYQREELKRVVKAAARVVCPFTASFSKFTTFENDEHTRAFLGIEVGAGHRELEMLSKTVEPILRSLHQKGFYSEPRFHASVAWALLATTGVRLQDEASTLSVPADTLPRVISSFPPQLLSDMESHFGKTLSSSKTGVFDVDSICVKIGKEISSWPLGLNE